MNNEYNGPFLRADPADKRSNAPRFNVRQAKLSHRCHPVARVSISWCITAFLTLASFAGAETPPVRIAAIIPAPAQCEVGAGSFALTAKTKIFFRNDAGAKEAAHILRAALKERVGLRVAAQGLRGQQQVENFILLETIPSATSSPAAESYSLVISPAGIKLRASTAAGLLYGVQSLLQLAAAQPPINGVRRLPAMTLTDAPRFAWRGLMLDESRHFFGKETVKQTLDMMAQLKLNRFHWHLTDENGWRIQIKKYPKLTSIGGKGSWSDANAPVAFYTQADIREIVKYAAGRHIMVIPEIDMPGHATAATRAYPQHSGGGKGQWEGFTFNPASEATYRFLEDILREVAGLFPGPYIHLGGDEVHFGNQSWKTNASYAQFARQQGLKDVSELEAYFVRRMSHVIGKLGKQTLGWDEIVGAGVPATNSAVMWWRHDKPQLLAGLLNQDYPVVLCPRLPCYFDFVQDDAHEHGRRWGGAFNTLADVHQFPDSLMTNTVPQAKAGNILGLQACVWTERIQNRQRFNFMTYPRLAAFAEAAWAQPAPKNSENFNDRLPAFLRELDRRGINYFDPHHKTPTPEVPGPAEKSGGTANG